MSKSLFLTTALTSLLLINSSLQAGSPFTAEHEDTFLKKLTKVFYKMRPPKEKPSINASEIKEKPMSSNLPPQKQTPQITSKEAYKAEVERLNKTRTNRWAHMRESLSEEISLQAIRLTLSSLLSEEKQAEASNTYSILITSNVSSSVARATSQKKAPSKHSRLSLDSLRLSLDPDANQDVASLSNRSSLSSASSSSSSEDNTSVRSSLNSESSRSSFDQGENQDVASLSNRSSLSSTSSSSLHDSQEIEEYMPEDFQEQPASDNTSVRSSLNSESSRSSLDQEENLEEAPSLFSHQTMTEIETKLSMLQHLLYKWDQANTKVRITVIEALLSNSEPGELIFKEEETNTPNALSFSQNRTDIDSEIKKLKDNLARALYMNLKTSISVASILEKAYTEEEDLNTSS